MYTYYKCLRTKTVRYKSTDPSLLLSSSSRRNYKLAAASAGSPLFPTKCIINWSLIPAAALFNSSMRFVSGLIRRIWKSLRVSHDVSSLILALWCSLICEDNQRFISVVDFEQTSPTISAYASPDKLVLSTIVFTARLSLISNDLPYGLFSAFVSSLKGCRRYCTCERSNCSVWFVTHEGAREKILRERLPRPTTASDSRI